MTPLHIGPYMTAIPLQITDRGEWEVRDRQNMVLGLIDYYPRWRQHVFIPERGAVLSHDCLRAISDFIKEKVP